jgi:hypothetical protein
MSKMATLVYDIEELLNEGMSPKFIVATLNCPIEMVYDVLDQLDLIEMQKQYEMMSYADEMANDDAQYYGA